MCDGCCINPDNNKQLLGCILFNRQTGCFPCTVCQHDYDGMCWGIVLCRCQIDPCWPFRNLTNLICVCMPVCCEPIKDVLFCVLCCNNKGHGVGEAPEAAPTAK